MNVPSVPYFSVHLSPTLTIEQALALGKERGVQLGIVEHPGPGYPINTDADLRHYIDTLRKYPVRIGLQPVYAGWSRSFSKNLLDELDYILMDALTLPNPDGTSLAMWQIDSAQRRKNARPRTAQNPEHHSDCLRNIRSRQLRPGLRTKSRRLTSRRSTTICGCPILVAVFATGWGF